jgi:hypothetical protein
LENKIFTQPFKHRHPTTGTLRETIYIKGHDDPFQNGDQVRLTIDIRPEKRAVVVAVPWTLSVVDLRYVPLPIPDQRNQRLQTGPGSRPVNGHV